MDIAAKLSRKAISTRRWDDVNPDPELAALEAELKDAINGLGLGAAGTGGDTVCLALKMGGPTPTPPSRRWRSTSTAGWPAGPVSASTTTAALRRCSDFQNGKKV